ncbi:hypothetical protein HHL17_11435 [Chitinophaga sp. G-6-1-13]|uniref:Uncharacterized protein n=1 Tax=Chitinophaga fulva TaxID=2728842 RepID=A0A848GIX2_9BACT|nr:hypothetical protein [Chitinophaga fulva]NML37807.1 hypothetical protein [Chitinophaga fulva]
MKQTILTLIIVLLGFAAVQAQYRPSFPDENGLKVKEDYAKYEQTMVAAADWLVETDLDKQVDVRRATNIFVTRWLTGSPNVTIVFNKPHIKLMEDNPMLLPVYMANYASYCIRQQSYKEALEPTKAGLAAIVKVYRKGIAVKKSKGLEKLAEAIDQGQLDTYISKNSGLLP